MMCLDGFSGYAITGSCYMFVDTPLMWSQARQECLYYGSYLVEVDSLDELNLMLEIYGNTLNVLGIFC